MGMYEDFHKINVIRPIIDSIRPNLYEPVVYPDGKHGLKLAMSASPSSPWILVRRSHDRLCEFWFDVIFRDYGLLPIGCVSCFKVCMKLDNLDQLFKTLALQKKMDLPSKCGIDERGWTDTLYSAFWYVPLGGGLEAGRELWKQVNKAVHKHVDPGIKVILKRA